MFASLSSKLLVGFIVATVILGGLAYWRHTAVLHELELERGKVTVLERDIAVVNGVNAANKATIERLEANRLADLAAIDKLSTAVAAVAVKADRVRTVVKEIERNDPQAAATLATLLPDGVRDALNGTAAPDN